MNLVYALLGGLVSIVGTLAGRVLFSLGFGYAVFKGIDASMAFFVDGVINQLQSLPNELLGVMNALGVGHAINIIASAVSVRLALYGLRSDSIQKIITATEVA